MEKISIIRHSTGTIESFIEGLEIHKAISTSDEDLVVFSYQYKNQTPGKHMAQNSVAQELPDLITLTDFLFADFKRDDSDFDLVRQALKQDGILSLEILI